MNFQMLSSTIQVASQNGNSSPQAPFSVRTEEVNADQGRFL